MGSDIFRDLAPAYWERGLSALPVKPGSKRPAVDKWTSYQANLPSPSRREEWLQKHGDCGIGINTGTEIIPGKVLVGIDVDDDHLTGLVQATLNGKICAKRGNKGATFFVLTDKNQKIKSTTLKGNGGLGNIDVLASGKFTVLPPTLHPDTNEPYVWIDHDLLDVDFADLPRVGQRTIDLIGRAIGSEHAAAIASGVGTHTPGVAFVAELVSWGATDEEITNLFRGLLPASYAGNSLKELVGWIKSAREKGFDQRRNSRDYDPGNVGPIPLGFTREGNYAFRDQTRSIILVQTANQLLNYQTLVGLAPSDFWVKQCPGKNGAFNPMEAGEALIQGCRDKGPFDPKTIRGLGVWKEGRDIVVNHGAELPPNLGHHYLAFSHVPISLQEDFDAAGLRDLIRLFPFKDANEADLLFAWTAVALLCGALDWRPHAFLFGPPNSGKTTLHNLIANILKPMVISADGQSTEAGIRQRLGPDALPTVIDEFETDSNHQRLQGVMRLARSASSAESPLLRGTPEGKALQFNIKTMMLLSAVNVTGMSPADQSRFIVAELAAHDSNPEVAARIAQESKRFSAMGPAWCGYMIGLAPAVLEAIETLKAEMHHVDSRLRQTMATLLAGMFAALNRRAPTQSEARALVEEYRTTISAHQVDQDRDNARECLEYLMSHIVRGSEGEEHSLGYWLAAELARIRQGTAPNATPDSKLILQNYQIKFHLRGEPEGFLIRNGAPPIDAVFRGTRWADRAWKRALGQLPDAFKLTEPQRFSGLEGKHRSIGLPLSYVPEEEDPALLGGGY